jgi:formyl-CoA transferase
VSALNPAVVYVSVTGFGQTGPLSRRAGYNLIAQGMSGIMALTGQPGDPPTRVGGSVADLAASFLAFGAACSALVQRFRTGRGQHLDVSLLASTLALLPDPVALYFESGVRPRREGNRNPNLTPAEAFRTADGHVTVVVMSPDQWQRFCGVLEDPAMASDPRFAAGEARLANHALFKERVEAALARGSTAQWVERFEAAGIAAGPIYEFDEVFADPQVKHLGLVAELEQPGLGSVRMLGFPFRPGGQAPPMRRPAPLLGEHTAEVLGDLGLAAEEIQRLATAGVVELGPPSSA